MTETEDQLTDAPVTTASGTIKSEITSARDREHFTRHFERARAHARATKRRRDDESSEEIRFMTNARLQIEKEGDIRENIARVARE